MRSAYINNIHSKMCRVFWWYKSHLVCASHATEDIPTETETTDATLSSAMHLQETISSEITFFKYFDFYFVRSPTLPVSPPASHLWWLPLQKFPNDSVHLLAALQHIFDLVPAYARTESAHAHAKWFVFKSNYFNEPKAYRNFNWIVWRCATEMR